MKSKIFTISLMGIIMIVICYSANHITSKANEFTPTATSIEATNNVTEKNDSQSDKISNTSSITPTQTTETENPTKDTTKPSVVPTKKATKKPTIKPTKKTTTEPTQKATAKPTIKPTVKPTKVPLPSGPVKIPTIASVSAPGEVVYTSSDNNAVIDASNINKGYIAVKYSGDNKKVKVQVKHNGEVYNYDLASDSKYDYYPLQLGNGEYTINVLENISGTKYSILHTETINVKITNPNSIFLQPNQYVWFTQSSNVVKVSAQVCNGKNTTLKKISAIFNYVTSNITYDYAKAKSAPVGYLPNVDEILKTGKGICFDYAAVFAAMCRAQGIPAKLITGYVAPNGVYHAWNEVYTKEKGWITVSFYLKSSGFNLVDPTFYSNMDSDKEAAKFIGNGTNYQNYHIY